MVGLSVQMYKKSHTLATFQCKRFLESTFFRKRQSKRSTVYN